MSRILIVTSNYWPEPTGISIYTTDLAEVFHFKGHQVSVLTGLPHYPWWKVPIAFSNLGNGVMSHNGIEVIRGRHLVPPKMTVMHRTRFEISLWWNLRRVANRVIRKEFDAVIAFIPTVAAGIVGNRISKRLKVPFGLIVQDLSGLGAKQSGLRGGFLISKFANVVEGRILKSAKSLVVISLAMKKVLINLGVDLDRINHILNYAAKEISIVDTTSARFKFGLDVEDFVVIHTGNMGAKQDLQNVVKAASFLTSDAKIKILLVGHGNQEELLKDLCESKNNIAILPAVSDSDYNALLSAADLLLVNERRTQMDMSLPSKLTSYLYSERPVLAAVPINGATWNFLEGIAELVDAGKPALLAQAIEELSRSPEKRFELASRGLEFARIHLEPETGRKKYVDWLENLLQSKYD
jgi:glycosyltransferase involved in cell wall biosynthesis